MEQMDFLQHCQKIVPTKLELLLVVLRLTILSPSHGWTIELANIADFKIMASTKWLTRLDQP